MKVRVSVTTKLLSIVVAMMLTVLVSISAMLIAQSHAEIEQQHRASQLKNQKQLAWIDELFALRLLVWIETFSQWGQTETLYEHQLAESLADSTEALSVSLQVSDVWLFGPKGNVLLGDEAAMPASVATMVRNTRNQMRPQNSFFCDKRCNRYVSAPIMIKDEQVAVVVMNASFSEMLATLSQFSGAYRIAVVRQSATQQPGSPLLTLVSQLSASNLKVLNEVISSLPANTAMITLEESGVMVTADNKRLLVSLLPLSDSDYFILSVRDISAMINSVSDYQNRVVGTAVLLFIVFTAMLTMMIHQYRTKLLKLAERLPLLADHRYQEFAMRSAYQKPWENKRLPDELDLLEATASNLAKQLEDQESRLAASSQQLENMAMFDSLTGLPNRTMMTFQIEKQIITSTRELKMAALLFLDLDDFKKVNDSHGHDVGDQLIIAAAERIVDAVGEAGFVGRFGGDEFVILLHGVTAKAKVEAIALAVLSKFESPILVDNLQFYVSASIGAATTTQSDMSAMELFRHADIAMYEAKAQKGAGFKLYDSSMNAKVMRKVELEREARVALRENHFSLALQPQIDIETHRLEGFEALIRWAHPVKGAVSPGEFIPMLENTPFMLELDYWVLNRSLRILSELRMAGYPDLKIAINMSAAQFTDISLPGFLKEQLDVYEIPPDTVELELTETALVSDLDSAVSVCLALQEMGCLVAMDDFGTGYSSLSYLKALPVDVVKIDQGFIRGMLDNPEDANIVESTIALVRSLGRTVIAEGVETREQLTMLGQFQCHQAQGYLISRPIPENELWERLDEAVSDGIWISALDSQALTPQHQFEF